VAASGAAALDVVRGGKNVDLVVTDVVMPGMSGPELGSRLAEIAPDLPVLYVSGYTDDAVIDEGILKPGTSFLSKPFDNEVLGEKVRELLDASERKKAA